MDIKEFDDTKKYIIKNFKKYSSYVNKNKLMYIILKKLVHTRTILERGRDEDVEEYYGIDKNGWVKHIQVSQYGYGPFEIIREETHNLSLDDMFDLYIKNKDEFLKFKRIYRRQKFQNKQRNIHIQYTKKGN